MTRKISDAAQCNRRGRCLQKYPRGRHGNIVLIADSNPDVQSWAWPGQFCRNLAERNVDKKNTNAQPKRRFAQPKGPEHSGCFYFRSGRASKAVELMNQIHAALTPPWCGRDPPQSVRALAAMHSGMALCAQRDQVPLRVFPRMAAILGGAPRDSTSCRRVDCPGHRHSGCAGAAFCTTLKSPGGREELLVHNACS